MKTRFSEPSKAHEATNAKSIPLEIQSHDPLKLLILPEGASPNACICTLSQPKTSAPCRYYFCPEKGIYEFTKVAAPKSARQSWLLGRRHLVVDGSPNPTQHAEEQPSPKVSTDAEEEASPPVSDGYIIKTPELLIATPIDPLFLVLPALHDKASAKSPSSKGLFLLADDILETLEETSKHFREVAGHDRIRRSIEDRMSAVCDTVDAGDETMFRLNMEKLLGELILKARNVVASGLPASMENKFVSRALEKPVMSLKREESSVLETVKDLATIGVPAADSVDSQVSTTTSTSAETGVSIDTELTIPTNSEEERNSSGCLDLLRLRVALSYVFSSYIPQPLVMRLNEQLTSADSPINFKPLDEELAIIAKMRSEALAARSMSDFSRKRGIDDEAAAIRAEKKARKEEEEKKKKASETRGLRDLKKVDTTGMKKMSDFFGKASAAKKKR